MLPSLPCCALTLPLAPQDLSRKDCLDAPGSSAGELPAAGAKLSSSPSSVGTLKRPTSLSRHASAAGFSLPAGPKGHKTPMSYSPMEGGDGPFIDPEDISRLLAHVAHFADALENLRDIVLRDGECPPHPNIAAPWDRATRGWGSLPGPEGTGTPGGDRAAAVRGGG